MYVGKNIRLLDVLTQSHEVNLFLEIESWTNQDSNP